MLDALHRMLEAHRSRSPKLPAQPACDGHHAPGFGIGRDGDIGGELGRQLADTYEHRSLGLASHWPFNEWGRILPDHATTVSMLYRFLFRRRNNAYSTTPWRRGRSFRMREAKTRGGLPPTVRPPHQRPGEAPAED